MSPKTTNCLSLACMSFVLSSFSAGRSRYQNLPWILGFVDPEFRAGTRSKLFLTKSLTLGSASVRGRSRECQCS
jgi:hypothetical protein